MASLSLNIFASFCQLMSAAQKLCSYVKRRKWLLPGLVLTYLWGKGKVNWMFTQNYFLSRLTVRCLPVASRKNSALKIALNCLKITKNFFFYFKKIKILEFLHQMTLFENNEICLNIYSVCIIKWIRYFFKVCAKNGQFRDRKKM